MLPLIRNLALASLVLPLAACKLAVIVTSGGDVQSASNTRNCSAGNVCEFDIKSDDFNETFTAIPRPGYEFEKWQSGKDFNCADSTDPVCVISNVGVGAIGQAVLDIFAGDKIDYAMPRFVFVGIDTDGDGIKDHLDEDDDNDGIFDSEDDCPLDADTSCGINEVGGMILADTIWTSQNGPIRLVDTVEVGPGVTLTISAGVELITDYHSIGVWGNLLINGTVSQPVTTDYFAVFGNDSASNIDIGYLHASGGAIFPSESTFSLRNSILERFQQIYFRYNRNDAFIEHNIFRGTSIGGNSPLRISHTGSSGTVYIRNNLFEEQPGTSGILIGYNNHDSSETLVVKYNSFLTGAQTVVAADNHVLDVSSNWWGTVDTTDIDNRILDRNDSFGYSTYVNYLPILTAPHPDTPTGF